MMCGEFLNFFYFLNGGNIEKVIQTFDFHFCQLNAKVSDYRNYKGIYI